VTLKREEEISTVALIPARGGSKGIPGKNMKEIRGKTLVRMTIEAAQESKVFDEIWVSSDESKILQHALGFGVGTHLRSNDASSDVATANDAVSDFLNSETKGPLTTLCYLQPTSPFRTGKSIRAAIELHRSKNFSPVIGVKYATELPEKLFIRLENGNLRSFLHGETSNINRQETPEYLYPNGSIYVFRIHDFHSADKFPIIGAVPFLMNQLESLDIDSYEDLLIARKLSA
jgi:CMP-N-acetylneuraminic acid synthetase